jgi:uncharacterized protein (TIGR01741 family)
MNTDNFEDYYQKIGNILNQMIPDDWTKVYLCAQIFGTLSQVFFYYRTSTNTIKYSLDIPEESERDDFDSLEYELYNTCNQLQAEFDKQKQSKWTSFSFILDSLGKMTIDYSYDDISNEDPVQLHDKWYKATVES